MDLLEIRNDEIKQFLKENNWVLLVIYQDNDMMSDFSLLTVKNVQYNIDKDIVCCKMKLDDYVVAVENNEIKTCNKECYPEILLLYKSNVFLRFPNFCRVSKMVDLIREKTA